MSAHPTWEEKDMISQLTNKSRLSMVAGQMQLLHVWLLDRISDSIAQSHPAWLDMSKLSKLAHLHYVILCTASRLIYDLAVSSSMRSSGPAPAARCCMTLASMHSICSVTLYTAGQLALAG